MKLGTKPEDNNKVIGLIVGVVGVFGFVIFRTVSALGGSGAEAPPVDGVVKSPNGDVKVAMGGPPAGATAANIDQATIDVKTFPLGTTPNPFHKDLDAGGITKPKGPTGRGNGGKGTLPPLTGPIVLANDEPPPPPITVMGVNMGRNPVVVMQVGDKAFVVNKGDSFAKTYRVKEVSEKQVVIDDGKQLHYIRVGAPAPVSAPATPDGSKPVTKETLPAVESRKLSGSI